MFANGWMEIHKAVNQKRNPEERLLFGVSLVYQHVQPHSWLYIILKLFTFHVKFTKYFFLVCNFQKKSDARRAGRERREPMGRWVVPASVAFHNLGHLPGKINQGSK